MSEELNRRYLTALKAVAKGRRSSTGQRRTPASERDVLKQHAKWAAESPVYQALVGKKKLIKPSEQELTRNKHFHALKDLVRNYKSGWMRKKVAPEHRESLKEHARKISEGKGTHFLPRATEEHLAAATALKKRVNLALVDGTWYKIDRVHNETGTRPSRGKDYRIVFLGVSMGYDMGRYVVITERFNSVEVAVEIAQNKWPHMFYEELISGPKMSKLEKKDPEEAERYEFVESVAKWGIPESNVWLREAREFTGGAIKIMRHSDLYRLPDGRVVEAK
jgi:hypothetical protein